MSSILVQTIGLMRRQRSSVLQLAGIIVDGGIRYQVLVSPRQGGDTQSDTTTVRQWKTVGDTHPAACETLTNGPAATQAMINAGVASYPAAGWAQIARNASVGGYNDWYVPARNELEIMYRNLKPTTTANTVAARAATGYGGDGLGYGVNASSDPVGTAYTASSPLQTTVPAFITTTGTEAFFTNDYWSSTAVSAASAWRHDFSNGRQSQMSKTSGYYVRLVRRVAA